MKKGLLDYLIKTEQEVKKTRSENQQFASVIEKLEVEIKISTTLNSLIKGETLINREGWKNYFIR